MNYWHLRVTAQENVDVAIVELYKRNIAGFGCSEVLTKTGANCPYHAHFCLFTDEVTVKRLRNAFTAAGVRGNNVYSFQKMKKTFTHLSAYVCKQYSPDSNVYRCGLEFTPEKLQEYKDAWDAGFDPMKASGGDKRACDMLEEICDGLDSSSSRQMVARAVYDYTVNHFKETKFWTDEKCRALVNSIMRQLNSHDIKFRDEMAERWV